MLTRDVINYYLEMLTQTKPEDTSLFIASSYFYHKMAGHSYSFHSTRSTLVARRVCCMQHAACRVLTYECDSDTRIMHPSNFRSVW